MNLLWKRHLAFLLLVAVLFSSVGVAFAYAEEATGTVTVANVAPTISAPTFQTTAAVNVNGTQITVNTWYDVSATIGDDNSLADISYVNFTFYHWTVDPATAAVAIANHYYFLYDAATDTWSSNPSGYIDTAACVDPTDLTVASGTYKARIKLHKVANYTTATGTDWWTIRIRAVDDDGASATNTALKFGVSYYSEITLDVATFSYGTVNPGTTGNPITTPAAGYLTATVLANWQYNFQMKGDADLVGATYGDTIPLSNVKPNVDAGSTIALTTTYQTYLASQAATWSGTAATHKIYAPIDIPSATRDDTYDYILYVGVPKA